MLKSLAGNKFKSIYMGGNNASSIWWNRLKSKTRRSILY
jgi:hypothetical protein